MYILSLYTYIYYVLCIRNNILGCILDIHIRLILLRNTNRHKIFFYCVFELSDIIVIVWTKFRSKACQDILSISPIDNNNNNIYLLYCTNLLVYFLFIVYTVLFALTIFSVFLHCLQGVIGFTELFNNQNEFKSFFFSLCILMYQAQYITSSDPWHSPKLFITITVYIFYPV